MSPWLVAALKTLGLIPQDFITAIDLSNAKLPTLEEQRQAAWDFLEEKLAPIVTDQAKRDALKAAIWADLTAEHPGYGMYGGATA